MKNLWNIGDLTGNPEIVVEGETLPQIFWNAVDLRGDQVWLRQKELGIWRTWTWRQVADDVSAIGHGLLALGLEPKACVSILSNTTANWVLSDLQFSAVVAFAVAFIPPMPQRRWLTCVPTPTPACCL